MRRVLAYIEQNEDGDLSLGNLSAIAAFSRHHFHRQFSALFGVTVYRYVQLLRLKRASYRIAFRPHEPITRIALDSGYEQAEAFSRAFRKRVGQTPTEFRRQPAWEAWHDAFRPFHQARSAHLESKFVDSAMRIVDFPETAVGMLRHHGDPRRMGESLRRFISWRKKEGLHPKTSATFNVLHTDPDSGAEDFCIDLCAAFGREVLPNDEGVSLGAILGGRCAVLRLTGASDDMRAAISFLYADWLPRSGEEPRDAPVFVQRLTLFPEVAEGEAITDVFLPLNG